MGNQAVLLFVTTALPRPIQTKTHQEEVMKNFETAQAVREDTTNPEPFYAAMVLGLNMLAATAIALAIMAMMWR